MPRILVTGATGKQGGATVRALVKANGDGEPKFEILAVTRNPASEAAKKLSALPNVTVVKGDLDDSPAIFKAAGHVDGVFSVQTFVGKGASLAKEEAQGKALADSAENAKVSLFVYTSVERGGVEAVLGIPHFDSKFQIENHIKAKKDLPYTILRPVAFTGNLVDPQMKAVFGSYLKQKLRPETKLQYIDESDIGEFARIAFENPSEYAGKTISLAGDAATFAEIDAAYKAELGQAMPTTFFLVPTIINLLSKEMRSMFAFFEKPGYSADIAKVREIYPGLKTIRQTLADSKKT